MRSLRAGVVTCLGLARPQHNAKMFEGLNPTLGSRC